jgi:hypothetical protein
LIGLLKALSAVPSKVFSRLNKWGGGFTAPTSSMISSSAISRFNITHIGALAGARLVPGQCGKVLASFSKAIYLITDDSELFWIVSEDAPMHRRALKTSTPLFGPQAGSLFHVQDQRLTIDSTFIFDMKNASLWSTPLINENNIASVNQISTYIQTLFSSLDLSKVKGFGNFIPAILSLPQTGPTCPQPGSSDPIIAHARPFVLNMARACLENQPSRISQNAGALIGLGPGLTPSGDDFVGGLLFCIYSLQTAYPELNLYNPLLLEQYRSRTHQISFTLLQDLANGHAIAPLHQIIDSIFSGKSIESIQPSISQLTQVGHSTGWDLLAGLLTGLLITYQNPSLRMERNNLLEDQAMTE